MTSAGADLWSPLRDAFRDWTGMLLRPSMQATALGTLARVAARLELAPAQLLAELRTGGQRAAQRALIDEIAIHTTWFDREQPGLRALVDTLRAHRPSGATVRIWSAGCSSGEEPLSIAMALLDAGLRPRILATDISPMAIATARRARYSTRALANVPPTRRARYFEPADDHHRATAAVRDCVQLLEHDVRRPLPAGESRFDAVVCRNLLLYFPRADASATLSRLADATIADGYVLLAAAEQSLTWLCPRVTPLPAAPMLFTTAATAPRAASPAAATPTRTTMTGLPAVSASPAAPATSRTPSAGARAAPPSTSRTTLTGVPALSPSLGAPTASRTPPTGVPTHTPARALSPSPAAPATSRTTLPGVPALSPSPATPGGLAPRAPTAAAAYTLLGTGDLETAARVAEQAISAMPLAPLGHLVRGLIARRRGQLAVAAEALRAARFLDPEDGWMATYNLGLCLEQLGDPLEAADAFRQALAAIGAGSASGLGALDADTDALAATIAHACRARLRALGG